MLLISNHIILSKQAKNKNWGEIKNENRKNCILAMLGSYTNTVAYAYCPRGACPSLLCGLGGSKVRHLD